MNILRLPTLSLAVAIAVLALAYANPSFAGKKCDADPNHPSCKDDGGGGDPPDSEIRSCPGDFPAFAYAVEITDKGGHTERLDLYLSNAEGTCQVLIHSTPHSRKFRASYDDLDFHMVRDDDGSEIYRVAYNYDDDEANIREPIARPNIRVMEFKTGIVLEGDVGDGETIGETKIVEDLPLAVVHKLYRYSDDRFLGATTASGRLCGNDMLGNSLVFSVAYGYTLPGKPQPHTDWYYEIRVIENISECIDELQGGLEPDESCSELVFSSHPIADSRALLPRWGLDTNRIYFDHCWWCDGEPSPALGILDRGSDYPWPPPGAVSIEIQDGIGLRGGSPAYYDYYGGEEPVEVEVLNQLGADGVLHFLEIGVGCTAISASGDSCMNLTSAWVVTEFPVPPLPHAGKWTTHGIIDEGPNPNLMYFDSDTNSIFEFDPDSGLDPNPETGNPRVIKGILDNVVWLDPVD